MATTASLSDLDDFRPRWRTGVSASLSPYLSLSRASRSAWELMLDSFPTRAVRFCDRQTSLEPPNLRRRLLSRRDQSVWRLADLVGCLRAMIIANFRRCDCA